MTGTVAERFIEAIASGAEAELSDLLHESAVVRVFDSAGMGAHRPLAEALAALAELPAGWLPNTLQFFGAAESGGHSAADFRIQIREGVETFDLNGAAVLSLTDGKVETAAVYLARPMRSLERGRIVPASLTEDERKAFIEAFPHRWDMREFFPPNMRFRRTPDVALVWTKVAHPGSNYVRLASWSEDEADARIRQIMDWYREQGLGIQWTVCEFDRPNDLGARLERHGFIRAGDQALMARFGLENLDDIPVNPDIEVIDLKQAPKHWEDSLQINATAFQWSAEQTENEREGWFEDLESEPIRSVMAILDGKPVADAHLYLQNGIAYLGGAATLPEFRNRKIYSTLLRRRLELARSEGYEVALIHAEPMSRRVVSRFGFETYVMYDVYGWMEPMDLEVIRSLVQDQ